MAGEENTDAKTTIYIFANINTFGINHSYSDDIINPAENCFTKVVILFRFFFTSA